MPFPLPNAVQLITYPDSLGGNLPALHDLLAPGGPLAGLFPGGIHLLPPFPSSGDRGFAPTTYFEIDPRFGSWDDVRRIGELAPVLLDLMVNHLSRRSAQFQDFARRGRSSPHADLFLTLDKVWPGGDPPPEDLAQIFLRRPDHPFADLTVAETGERERVWATFGTRAWAEQIDLDVRSPAARRLFASILAHFSRYGVRLVRLDAVAFVIKKPGTSCFFVEPELYEFLDWIGAEAAAAGIELLPEVHAHHSLQDKLARHGSRVYDFALPLLVLHALLKRDGRALAAHLRACPRRQFTTLDTHDGIPVQPDVDDLLPIDKAQAVVAALQRRGANLSRILSAAHLRRPNFDAHQVNITYYSALGGDDDAYLAARALQFFAPGVPQVYYVGLLAGENDPPAVERAGDRRAINRHDYTPAEIQAALRRPIVQRLFELIRFRNTHPAFAGEFEVQDSPSRELRLVWRNGAAWAALRVDLEHARAEIQASESEQGDREQGTATFPGPLPQRLV